MANKRFRYEIIRQVDVVAKDEEEAFEKLKEQHQYCYPDVSGEKSKGCDFLGEVEGGDDFDSRYFIGESKRIKKW